ncbi:MAG TPA: class I SAM-dependent RNA methyltransferase [Ktedonobacterales bacterium]|nr:class I SAM-dependent RNA methyltransferase [Ktedonobacterales bacterium]
MQDDAITAPERHPVTARALVRVERLSRTGEAAALIERWLQPPPDADWRAVWGTRYAGQPLPEECEFIGGLPGELIEVELRWSLPRPGRKAARRPPSPRVSVIRVIEPDEDRVAAPCPVFGACGGCQLQHLTYVGQLAWKAGRVAGALAATGVSGGEHLPPIGCDDPWHYRNHMRFSVDRAGRAGLTARGSKRVIPLTRCPIAHPLINTALAAATDCALPRPQWLVRVGAGTGEMLIQPAPDDVLRARLTACGLEVLTDAITEALTIPAAGGGADSAPIRATFRIRPSSFFQTNTPQADRMAAAVLAGLPHGTNVCLVDAYCGVGTFAALLAPAAGRVYAVEESASAIRDARWNLRDLPHIEIVQDKVEVWLPTFAERLDGLVIDPPRAGCARPLLEALAARRVPRVVYVSCEPSTLARDLAYLTVEAGAYRVRTVQPLDMFPQTHHIETIVTLEAV